jgi:hypothetical protein
MFNGASFLQPGQNWRLMVFKDSLCDINNAIEVKDLKERPFEEIVPEQYYEFLP